MKEDGFTIIFMTLILLKYFEETFLLLFDSNRYEELYSMSKIKGKERQLLAWLV